MEKAIKWIGIAFIVVLVIAIATGYRGGSKEATANYHNVMSGK